MKKESRYIAPTIIESPKKNSLLMQEEIFGPLMPVKTYKNIDEVIQFINNKPRPLGLYYFGKDQAEERTILDRTISGGVTLNDVVMHVSQEDLPFGGVGPSGMGSYHGFDGFKTFSHTKSIYTQSKMDIAGMTGMSPVRNREVESPESMGVVLLE